MGNNIRKTLNELFENKLSELAKNMDDDEFIKKSGIILKYSDNKEFIARFNKITSNMSNEDFLDKRL